MSDEEIHEVEQITSESVTHSTPLVWKSNTSKPSEHDLTVSRAHGMLWVFKGVLVSLYPKWGVLRTSRGDVFFEAQHLYIDNARNVSGTSLLNFLELGDVLAVQCRSSDYLEMSEIARGAPGFVGRTDSLAYLAKLVWNIQAELDPYTIAKSDDDIQCNFLTTSSTLNCPWPQEREARYTNLYGVVEELHLPAGGIVTLDAGSIIEGATLTDEQRHVYFHRSRIYLNGTKLLTSSSLETSLVPGDRVAVDVMHNQNSYFVASQAYWIALSLRVHTTERGVSIANTLRMEVVVMPGVKCLPPFYLNYCDHYNCDFNTKFCYFVRKVILKKDEDSITNLVTLSLKRKFPKLMKKMFYFLGCGPKLEKCLSRPCCSFSKARGSRWACGGGGGHY
jgi:hypothetical protein